MIETYGNRTLAQLFPLTFGQLAGLDGISWEAFAEGGPESVGAMWMTLLNECKTVQEKIEAAMMVLQRFTATPWVDAQGQERSEPLPWEDGKTPGATAVCRSDCDGAEHSADKVRVQAGIGALLSVNAHGQPIVSRVARPGSASFSPAPA